MKVIRLTEPASVPIAVDRLQAQLNADDTDDLPYLDRLLRAAFRHVEDYCGRPFAAATFAVIYDNDLPSGLAAVSVPVADVTAVSSVGYRDPDGAAQTWDAANWRHDAERQVLTPLENWPEGTELRIAVAAGGSGDLPLPIETATLMIAADLHDLRQAHVVGTTYSPNPRAEALMAPYRERMGI